MVNILWCSVILYVLLVVDCTKIRHYKSTAQGPQLAYIQPLDEKERETSQFHTGNTQGNHVPSDQVNPPATGVLTNSDDEGHPGYFLHVSEHDLKKLQRHEDKREKKAKKDEDKRSKRNHGNQKGSQKSTPAEQLNTGEDYSNNSPWYRDANGGINPWLSNPTTASRKQIRAPELDGPSSSTSRISDIEDNKIMRDIFSEPMEYDARRDENGDERTQGTNLADQEHVVHNNHMMPVYPVQPDDSDNNIEPSTNTGTSVRRGDLPPGYHLEFPHRESHVVADRYPGPTKLQTSEDRSQDEAGHKLAHIMADRYSGPSSTHNDNRGQKDAPTAGKLSENDTMKLKNHDNSHEHHNQAKISTDSHGDPTHSTNSNLTDEVEMTPPTIKHNQAHVMADRYQGPSSEMDAINSGDLIRAASPVILILAAATVLVMRVQF